MNLVFKRIALAGGAMVLVLAVILVAASVYLNSASFGRRLAAGINRTIAGHIRIEGHSLDLPGGRLVLSGLELCGAEGRSIAHIGQLRLRLFWPALLWHSLDVSTLRIDRARFTLIADARDRLNLAGALAPLNPHRESRSSWIRQVVIGDMRLHDGQIEYRHPHKGWSGRIAHLEVSGSGNLKRRTGRLRLRAEESNLRAAGRDQSLQDVTVDIRYRGDADIPATIEVRTTDTALILKGRLERNNGEVSLALTSDLDLSLAQVRPWLPGAGNLSGRLTGRIDLTGALKDPSATLRLHLADGAVKGIPIQSAALNVRLKRRQVIIDSLNVRSTWGEGDLSGAMDLQPVFPDSFEHRVAGWDALRYALDISGRRLTPEQIPGVTVPVGGRWQLQAHAKGRGLSGAAAEGTGTISLKGQGVRLARPGPPATAGFLARMQWARQAVRIIDMRAELDRNELDGKGRLQWNTGRFEVDVTAQSPRLGELGDILGARLPGGTGTLRLQARGSLHRPMIHVVLLSRDVAMAAWSFGQMRVEADLGADGVVNFTRLELVNKGGTLQGHGRLHLLGPDGTLRDDPALNLHLDLAALDLAAFSPGLIDGDLTLNGRLNVGGRLRHPIVDLRLASSPVRWKKRAGRVEGRIRWQDGRLIISHLNLAGGQSVATLKGTSRWRDPASGRWISHPVIQADLAAGRFFLQDWISEASGALAFKAALRGRIPDLKGTFDVRGSGLTVGGQKFSALRLEGRLVDQTVHADRIVASLTPGQTVQGNGWYSFDRRFRLRLSGDDIALHDIAALQRSHDIQGRLTVSVDARGTVAQPVMHGRLVVRNPRIGGRPWHDFNARIDLDERRLTLDADLNFKLAAHYRLDSGDFDVAADFDHTDLRPYLSLLAGGRWAGRLTGTVRAAGNRHDPEGIDAHIALTQADLAYRKIDLLHLDRLEADLAKGRVTMPTTRMVLMKDGELTVGAAGRLQDQVAIQTQGDIPLAALAPFTDRVGEATGRIRFTAQGKGPWNKVQWRGQAAVEKGGFLWEEWDQSVHDVNGTVRIDAGGIAVDHLSGMLESGRFSLDGQLRMADGRPVQGRLSLNAHALPVHWPDTMDLSFGTALVFTVNPDQASLTGRVTLLEGTYYRNVKFDLMSRITRSRRAEPVSAAWSPPPWLPPLGLNITIGSRYPLLVDNNVAQLQIMPDFKIGGSLAHPVVTGRAQVTEGDVMFRGRTFTVTRGVVDFVNPYKIEPTLDVAAEAQIRQWKVTLTASGPPDNLLVKLSSDPAESDSNILSLILLGRTSAELSQGGSGASPEQMLATLLDSAWGEKIKKSTGVDILQVETGAQEANQNPDRIQVTVGKHLSPRFTVKYSVEATAGSTIQRATSEYQLLEHFLASGFQDTAGAYGGELQFRIEFR